MDTKITPLNLQKFKLFMEKTFEESSPDSPDFLADKIDLSKHGSLNTVGSLSTSSLVRTPPLPKRSLRVDLSKRTPETTDRKKAAEAPV